MNRDDLASVFRILKKNKISQGEVAKELAISESHLSKIISGEKNLTNKIVTAFNDKYGHVIKLEEATFSPGPAIPIDQLAEDQSPEETYIAKRRNLKSNKQETLMYYQIGANAATRHTAEVLPVKKEEGVLHISDLFKGSEYAIRVSGNSMTPNYPSGAIIGIREIHDKQITPGSVYVIEKENDLWLKRLFYKDDNQDSGFFECASDNNMKYENGTRIGKLYYPSFEISIDKVRKLFKVTGIYKPNELTVIN